MVWVKRATEFLLAFVLFPIALVLAASLAIAVGLQGLAAYLGGILTAWLLFAYILPMLTGVLAPSELFAGIRSRRRRRTHYEGEPLPDWDIVWWNVLKKPRDAE